MKSFENQLPLAIKIQISEPWDFDIGNGKNYFYGTLLNKIRGLDGNDYYIVKILKVFTWNKTTVDYILVSTRYQGEGMSDLIKKRKLIVGIDMLKDKSILTSSSFQPNQIEYFAIGSISIEDKENNGKKI
jgi:hypothetical protein